MRTATLLLHWKRPLVKKCICGSEMYHSKYGGVWICKRQERLGEPRKVVVEIPFDYIFKKKNKETIYKKVR